MRNFNSIEEKVIFEKLTQGISASENIINENKDGSFDALKISKYMSEITGYINILDNNRQNFAYRPVLSYKKYIGRMIVFGKKVVRRLLKFYVEPIAFQQTEFNNAVTPSIGRLTEIQAELLNGIVLLKNENKNMNEELKAIKNKNKELEDLISSKMEDLQRSQEIANQQIRKNEKKLSALDELELDIFKEKESNFWNKKTVAQSGEDSICAYINMVLGRPLNECTYLDLGANHAKDLSNTYFFYSNGARGVLVEANPALIPELKFYRNEDLVLNKCISTNSGEYVDFYVMSGDGLSTTSIDSAKEFISKNPELKIVETVKLETITVNDIIKKYMGKTPVIMNIDIEGKDLEILESIDFEKYRPLIIITEMIDYKPKLVVPHKNNEIMEFMKKNEYTEYAFTGINSIFIDKRQIEEV